MRLRFNIRLFHYRFTSPWEKCVSSLVGDLKTTGNGIEVTITDDTKKASAFCKYFSSVFTAADVSPEQRLNLKADTTELIPDTDELDT